MIIWSLVALYNRFRTGSKARIFGTFFLLAIWGRMGRNVSSGTQNRPRNLHQPKPRPSSLRNHRERLVRCGSNNALHFRFYRSSSRAAYTGTLSALESLLPGDQNGKRADPLQSQPQETTKFTTRGGITPTTPTGYTVTLKRLK